MTLHDIGRCPVIQRDTIFSADRKYRYTLWRDWWNCDLFGGDKQDDAYVQFIGLNPSTADEIEDDPTIRRCRGFVQAWGYGAMCMTNLFAWRDTSPDEMKKAESPVGLGNDYWLKEIARGASVIIAAWGTNGVHLGRDRMVLSMIPKMQCLRKTAAGHPEHPLYLPKHLTPIPFS